MRYTNPRLYFTLSIDDCCCENNCHGGQCSLPHRAPRISESMFKLTTTSMVDHDEENRREQNLIVRSRKSTAELVLDVFY